jgi:ribose transport system permease protein
MATNETHVGVSALLSDRAWRRRQLPTLLAYLVGILIFTLISVFSPVFASGNNIRNIIQQAAILGVVAIGQTLVILTGGIDLSVPAMMSLAGVLLARLTPPDGNLLYPFVVVFGIAVVVGAVNGVGVGIFRAPPIIMTLGINSVLAGTLVVTAKGVISGGGATSNFIRNLVVGTTGPIPNAGIFWLLLTVIVSVVLSRTPFGRMVYAIGNNPTAARISGVNVAGVLIALYIISACTSALSGWMLAGYLSQSYSTMGDSDLFVSITAVLVGGASLLGGSGDYLGTVAGAVILTILGALLVILNLGAPEMRILNGAIIFLTVAASTFLNKDRR